jgi:O-antigen ligase
LSDNKRVAFFGDTQRRNGFITYVCLFSIWIAIIAIIQIKHLLTFKKYFIVTFLLLIFYGFLQYFNYDFVKWSNPYNRILLTVGNPNFSSALLGIFSLVFLGTFKQSRRILTVLQIGVLVSVIFLIYSSQSRQGLIALTLGGLATFIMWYRVKGFRYSQFAIPALLGGFGLVSLGLFKLGPLASILYKGSIETRFFYWRAALRMFLSHPSFGIGIDRYQYYFKQYVDVGYIRNYGVEITSSNAHSLILQFLATTGIFFTSVYLVVIGFTIVRFAKLIHKTTGDNQKLFFGIFGAWVAYLAQSVISIDNIALSIWGWALSGILIGASYLSFSINQDFEKVNTKIDRKKRNLAETPLLSIVALATISVTFILSGSERQMFIFYNTNPNDQNLILMQGNRVLNSVLVDDYNKVEVARGFSKVGSNSEAEVVLRNVIKEDERNLDAYLLLSYIYEQTNHLDLAINYREKLAMLDPNNVSNLVQLALNYKRVGNEIKAQSLKHDVLLIDPNSQAAKYALDNL